MNHDAPSSVPRGVLLTLSLYLAALFPVLAWGLWSLIDGGTVNLPGHVPPGALASSATAQDTLNYLKAHQESRLVLSQGQMYLAVLLAGGIGSYIHGVTSFVTFVGNRRFKLSWVPWYAFRPLMGMAMALVFYLVVRGGVLVISGGVSQVDPYALMTIAALAGMFSKQASDKLAEVFDTLFRARADAERRDKLAGPLELSELDPRTVKVGATEVITIRGKGFVDGAVVRLDGENRATTFTNSGVLTFQLLPGDVTAPGDHKVEVFNPGPEGSTTSALTLVVEAAPSAVQVHNIVGADDPGAAGNTDGGSSEAADEPVPSDDAEPWEGGDSAGTASHPPATDAAGAGAGKPAG
jgi:hypothetical protein